MITSKMLVEGSNLIDGKIGEYIGTFWDGDHFTAVFDRQREGGLDQFDLVVTPFDTPNADYPREYSVECFGVINGQNQAVLMNMEN